MLVTRALGPVDKGKYALVITTIGMLMQLSNFGLHTANTYFVSKERNALSNLFSNSIFWILVATSVVNTGFLIFNWAYPGQIHMFENGYGFVVLGTYAALINTTAQNMNIAIGNVRFVNKYNVISKVVTLALVSLLFFTDRLTVPYALAIAILEFVLIGTLCVRLLVLAIDKISFKPDYTLLKKSLYYGFKAHLVTLMSYMVIRSDVYLVKYYLGDQAVGFYSSAVQIIDQVAYLGVAVNSLLMPKLSAEKDPEERVRLTKRSFNHLAVLLLFACGGCFIFARYIVLILFGEDFLGSVEPFRLLLIAIFFLSIESSLAQYLASIGFPWSLIWAWLVAFGTNLGLNMYLIPKLGVNGAAYSSMVSYFVIFAYVGILMYQHAKKVKRNALIRE